MFGFRKKPLKKVPFKKTKKVIDHTEIDNLRAFFLSIWKKYPHYCIICGTWLGNEPRSYMFDHLLEKSKYPELQYEEENIILVCLDCHDCKTRGMLSSIYTTLIEKTKKRFMK